MTLRKFTPPALSEQWLRRTRLMELLDRAVEHGLVYVAAPAGSGKTVAVAEWLGRSRNKVAWLALDRYDNEPANFYSGLLGAMAQAQQANRTLRRLALQAADAPVPRDFFLKAMERTLDNEKIYCLVLDDLHNLDNPEILAELPRVIARFPNNFNLLVLSRRPAPEPFAGLIAKNQIALISAADLRFTSAEVRELSRQLHAGLADPDAAALCREVGGWAMGVGLRLQSTNPGGGTVPAPHDAGGNGYFEHFLENQIWANWSAGLRDLLLKTAPAPELDADLAAYLTGRDDCREMLEELARENAFVASMGEGRYRLHDLFRDWLMAKWEKKGKANRTMTTLRLARWYHREEKFFRAIDLYGQVGDFAAVAQTVRDMSRYDTAHLAVESHIRLMQGLVRRELPPGFVQSDLQLLALYAWGNFLLGDDEAFFRYVDILRDPKQTRNWSEEPALEAKFFVLSLDFRAPLLDSARLLAENMSPLPLPGGNPAGAEKTPLVNTITQNLPLAHRSMRDFSELIPAGEAGYGLLRATFGACIGADYQVLEDCIRGGLHYERGEYGEAMRLALQACRAAEKCRSPEFQVSARALLRLLLLERGETEAADHVARDLEKYLTRNDLLFLWPNLRAEVFAARFRRGDAGAVEEWLSVHADSVENDYQLSFYKFPRHFTTARAYLQAGNVRTALLFLDRLRSLAGRYRRPLDRIETELLRCQAYWRLEDAENALAALEEAETLAGAYGYVGMFAREMGHIASPLRMLAFRRVQEGGDRSFLKLLSQTADAPVESVAVPLSPRQQDLLRQLREGRTVEETAAALGITVNTAKTHLKNIYRALGVRNRAEAVAMARLVRH